MAKVKIQVSIELGLNPKHYPETCDTPEKRAQFDIDMVTHDQVGIEELVNGDNLEGLTLISVEEG